MRIYIPFVFALCLSTVPVAGVAQDQAFGSARQDRDLPVEVEADELSVDQQDGTATLNGNVVITQGDMILSAPHVLVIYTEDDQKIQRLEATGGVTVVSGPDAAEAQNATYNIDGGTILMTGDVLLNQSGNVITGQRITIDLDAGTATAGGRVRTTLQPGGDQ